VKKSHGCCWSSVACLVSESNLLDGLVLETNFRDFYVLLLKFAFSA
jgi:hypothetical protein